MADRRLLRRYLSLVREAEDSLDEDTSAEATPVPAEAVAFLDGLSEALSPIAPLLPDPLADPGEVRRVLAGWVH